MINIDDMLPGRTMNNLIAEVVMGWEPYSGGYYYGKQGYLLVTMAPPGEPLHPFWNPSENIMDAWKVLREFPHFFLTTMKKGVTGNFAVIMQPTTPFHSNHVHHEAEGKTMALAICRAAYKAKMAWKEQGY